MRKSPKKTSVRLIILVSVLFVLVLGLIRNYYQQKRLNLLNFSSLNSYPSPTLSQKLTSTPTPIIRQFTSGRQNILVTIPKYADTSNEKETYEISFDKVSAKSGYYLTSEIFPKLVILDKNYEFSIELTKEAVGNLEEAKMAFTEVSTNQFGKLKKIVLDNKYKYFTDYYAVNLFPQGQSSFAYMTCKIIGEDRGECDKIISTLSIKLK